MRPTKLPKPLRTGGLALAALVLVSAGVIYALDDGSSQAPQVELAAAKRGTVIAAVSAAGNTVDDGTRELGFGGAGTVTKVYVKAGDKVDKGDVLARIGSAPARERYDAAKAQLAAAQEALDGAGSTPTTAPARSQGQGRARAQGPRPGTGRGTGRRSRCGTGPVGVRRGSAGELPTDRADRRHSHASSG